MQAKATDTPGFRGSGKWRRFRHSPFLPASVLVVLLSAAAGLFAGSYSYSAANPRPHHIPIAAVASAARDRRFVQALDAAMGTRLTVRSYRTLAAAHHALDDQVVFAVLRGGRHAGTIEVASASGVSVSRLFIQNAPKVGVRLDYPITVTDVRPVQRTDPQGLGIFYISLAAVVVGFMGAVQLFTHAEELREATRVGFTAAYALLGGLSIAGAVDPLLGVLRLPFAESWAILALTMFVAGMAFTGFRSLFGRWAVVPTWILLVIIGNPNSGGSVSLTLLPPVMAFLGRWLPPGASVSAQRNAIYFHGHQHIEPFLVLAAWGIAGLLTFVLRERYRAKEAGPRHEGTRPVR